MRGSFSLSVKGTRGPQATVPGRLPLCGGAPQPRMLSYDGARNERSAPLSLYEKGERSMNYDPELAALLSQPWSEGACRGYVISAMERCGFKPTDIEQVMLELHEVFDYTTPEEAAAYYERSPY